MTREDIEFDFNNELSVWLDGVENRWEKELIDLSTDFLEEKGYTLERIQKTKDKGETIDIFNEVHWEYNSYWSDMGSERADSMVDIYTQDLYEKALEYSHWINEGIENNDFCDLLSIFQTWQYMYYEQLAGNALQAVENYINE